MKPESQRIVTKCTACVLHQHCYTVGMNPVGPPDTALRIFLDSPPKEDDMRHKFGASNISRFVRWMMLRNGLKEEDYQIAFTLKCAIPKNFLTKKENKQECVRACSKFRIASLQNAKVVLAMGELSVMAFLGKPLKKVVGCFWPSREISGLTIAASYAAGYPLAEGKAGESVSMARIMWMAAEKAGLKPYFNPDAGLFDYNIF